MLAVILVLLAGAAVNVFNTLGIGSFAPEGLTD